MKITPVGDQIFLEIEEAKLGGLKTDSIKTGMEWATIKAIGPDVPIDANPQFKVGDKVFVKAWGVDIILYEGKSYHFTSAARKAIVAVLK